MEKCTLLKLNNLSYTGSAWTKLQDFNLELFRGEVFALVGESGSGKTTFINILAGIINTNITGQIYFNDRLLNADDRKKRIGFLLEKPSLVPNLTIAENISLLKYPFRRFLPLINWTKVRKMTQEVFAKYGFELDYHQKVSTLSTEEKKLVEIAKVLIKNPQMIILHEPTTGLSSETISKLYTLINQYKKEGGTVIYVTKQWEEALKIADRISLLYDGKIVGTLLSDEAKKNPRRLLNMFLGNHDKAPDESEEDIEVLDAVFKAAEFLTSEYELKDILGFFAEHATKAMNADGCIINLIDEKTNTIIDTVSFTSNKREPKPVLKWEAIHRIIQKNSIYYSNERESEFKTIFINVGEVKTIMCVPVQIRSQVTGIIQIYYNNIFVYSEKEWRYISTLARQAAIAIEDTRLLGKSALLQESHHRIKNNLQSIVSLIVLQKNFLKENMLYQEVDNILDDIISRIKSIAAVHELLSTDKLGRSIINLKEIVNKVLQIAAYPNTSKQIRIILDLDDIFIPYNKATTIILIINELVANCYEHAFKGLEEGQIQIRCKKTNDGVLLNIKDDGLGVPRDFQLKNSKTLGLNIVYSVIVNEFQGEINLIASEDQGTQFQIFLPAKNCF